MAGPHGPRATRPWRRPGSGRHASAKSPALGGVAFVAPPREWDRHARTPTFTNRHLLMEATPRQRRETARLITRTAEPLTFDEASRLIGRLRREEMALPRLIEEIMEADRAGDRDRLGRLLARAKRRVRHGDWLALLREIGINQRRAQRLIAQSTSPIHRKGKR